MLLLASRACRGGHAWPLYNDDPKTLTRTATNDDILAKAVPAASHFKRSADDETHH